MQRLITDIHNAGQRLVTAFAFRYGAGPCEYSGAVAALGPRHDFQVYFNRDGKRLVDVGRSACVAISSKTRKMLWGRSASRCSICRSELVMDATETDDVSIIGDECHIVAREQDGPRGESHLSADERDLFDNLILLCKNHHKEVDDQVSTYTVECLQSIKDEHTWWVKETLDVDGEKQDDEEALLGIIDMWEDLADIEYWTAWTSWVFGNGQPSLEGERDAGLKRLVDYLYSRVYPSRHSEVCRALENFMVVLNDFRRVFHQHSEPFGKDYITSKFYRIPGRYLDDAEYSRVGREFDFHVDLVQDLALELTRAGNYVCETVRRHLLRSYRLVEGLLVVESGPHEDLGYRRHRPQYRDTEKGNLYPGFEQFLETRTTRDLHFGVGVSSTDPRFLALESDRPW